MTHLVTFPYQRQDASNPGGDDPANGHDTDEQFENVQRSDSAHRPSMPYNYHDCCRLPVSTNPKHRPDR